MGNEITDSVYWDTYWGRSVELPTYDASRGLFYSYDMLFKRCFEKLLSNGNTHTLRVLDCGCGEGMMLRFFQERFAGLEIAGIDYSEAIHKAERMAAQLGWSWNLMKWNMNDGMPPGTCASFDVVASFGLVEHFRDPLPILRTIRSALKNGGCMITVIPNFTGIFNTLWEMYDRENYRQHMPITAERLVKLHEQIGLETTTIYRLGGPILPGIHNDDRQWQKALRWMINNLNGRIVQRAWPRQQCLDRGYSLSPNVACVAFQE